jgi:hypothetical protein
MLRKSLMTILATLTLVCSSYSQEETKALDLTGIKPGDYHLRIDAQGVVSFVRPLKLFKIGGTTNPPPTDETFDQAVTRFTRVALASGGTKTTGAALSSVYSLVSSGVSDGSITPTKALEAVRQGSNIVIAEQEDGAKWKTFRDSVGSALTTLANEGKLTTKQEISSVLKRISDAMNVATGFSGNPAELATEDPSTAGILDGIDIAKIIELIKLVMELLKLFGGM